jgi:hypothetical protein
VLPALTQRKTQTPTYWQKEFTVNDQDAEFIYNHLLEDNRLFGLDEITTALIKRHCEVEEMAIRSELKQGKIYRPQDTYAVGEAVVFPHLGFAPGLVKEVRPGNHPDYSDFQVITVGLKDGQVSQEFVAGFHYPHVLSTSDEAYLVTAQGGMTPEEIEQAYGETVRAQVKAAFKAHKDFVEFHEQYFLAELLPKFHEGLFNIVDAAIDINHGPLSVDALIEQIREQMGLAPAQETTDLIRFSVSYHLANDQRFDNVGPTGQVMWYLERLEPPEARIKPRHLQAQICVYDPSLFDEDLYDLLAEIDDELTDPEDIPAVGTESSQVTLVLNYPHRRTGTLPLTPKTESFFPASRYNPVLFEFVDGRTGDKFPGWTVADGKYIFGLNQWYEKNKLPVGAYLNLKRTPNPMQVIIEYQFTRTQRDWVRVITVAGHSLTFRMNTEPLGCKYDELMIIGIESPTELDGLWLNSEKSSVYEVLCQVFPELSKLNPQSTVHAKTLYSAVNVIHRAAPGAVFQELANHRCFTPMKHGYWVYDPKLRD